MKTPLRSPSLDRLTAIHISDVASFLVLSIHSNASNSVYLQQFSPNTEWINQYYGSDNIRGTRIVRTHSPSVVYCFSKENTSLPCVQRSMSSYLLPLFCDRCSPMEAWIHGTIWVC